jgi:hypothetical protein
VNPHCLHIQTPSFKVSRKEEYQGRKEGRKDIREGRKGIKEGRKDIKEGMKEIKDGRDILNRIRTDMVGEGEGRGL